MQECCAGDCVGEVKGVGDFAEKAGDLGGEGGEVFDDEDCEDGEGAVLGGENSVNCKDRK